MKLMAVCDFKNKSKLNMLRASCSGHELVLPRDTGSGLLKRYSVEAQAKGCAAVLVAHEEVLKNLVSRSGHSSEGVTLNDYSGSTFDTEGIRWLILDNLNNIYATRMVSSIPR